MEQIHNILCTYGHPCVGLWKKVQDLCGGRSAGRGLPTGQEKTCSLENNSGMDLDKSSTTRYFWCGLVCPWEAQHAFLVPLPVADSSHQVVIDIVGPLAQTWSGNHYIQVVCNYTTCYQEALTLRSVDPKHIMKELVKSTVFERVSILSRCLMPPHMICVGGACIDLCRFKG